MQAVSAIHDPAARAPPDQAAAQAAKRHAAAIVWLLSTVENGVRIVPAVSAAVTSVAGPSIPGPPLPSPGAFQKRRSVPWNRATSHAVGRAASRRFRR